MQEGTFLFSLVKCVTELDICSGSTQKSAYFEAFLVDTFWDARIPKSLVLLMVSGFKNPAIMQFWLLSYIVFYNCLFVHPSSMTENSVVFPCPTPRIIEHSFVEVSESNFSDQPDAHKEVVFFVEMSLGLNYCTSVWLIDQHPPWRVLLVGTQNYMKRATRLTVRWMISWT